MYDIASNHHWREPVMFHDLPVKEKEYFDYLDDVYEKYEPRLVKYRGDWYDIGEAQTNDGIPELWDAGWHGAIPLTMWSGIVVGWGTTDDTAGYVKVGYFVTKD